MAEKEKKTENVEERVDKANKILNMIVAKTYARHSKLTEEEFLKEIGFENSGKTEDEAVRIAIYNLLIETTRELFKAKEAFSYASAILSLYLKGENITENENKGE